LGFRGQSPHRYGNSRSGWTQTDLAEETKAAAAQRPTPGALQSLGQSPHRCGNSRSGWTQDASAEEMRAAAARGPRPRRPAPSPRGSRRGSRPPPARASSASGSGAPALRTTRAERALAKAAATTRAPAMKRGAALRPSEHPFKATWRCSGIDRGRAAAWPPGAAKAAPPDSARTPALNPASAGTTVRAAAPFGGKQRTTSRRIGRCPACP